jgi:hypothetical protein
MPHHVSVKISKCPIKFFLHMIYEVDNGSVLRDYIT